jgi:2-oxoglutarate/2-oxoacid ferredoxin oxidoreductase subunit alpha
MNSSQYTIKVGGPAGSGVKSIGLLLQKALQRIGFYTFGYTEYPSLIRGGHNIFQVDFSSSTINSSTRNCDLLLALDTQTIKEDSQYVNEDGVIIYDSDVIDNPNEHMKDEITLLDVPISKTLEENDIPKIMQNSVQLGVIMAICDYPIEALYEAIAWTFSDKEKDIIDKNKKAAKIGFDLIEGTEKDMEKGLTLPEDQKKAKPNLVLTANESCGLGFISAGGKLYSAYPMTPSTNILHYLARHGAQKDIVVRQASTEIEAIGLAAGASFGGIRSMVATSGGGLALMGEFISMLGIAELPVVMIDAQRTGPATGLPTWQEQSDLNMAKRVGHGEFPRIVCAPGDPLEAYNMTIEALELADKYQIPIIMLTDKHVAESYYSVSKEDYAEIASQTKQKYHGKTWNSIRKEENGEMTEEFKRYDYTEDGVSKRSIPGWKDGIYIANSDDHAPTGYSIEDSDTRIKQQDKRMRKLEAIKEELKDRSYSIYGEKSAKTVIVGWGSTKGTILDTIDYLNSNTDKRYAFLQIKYLYPMNKHLLKSRLSKYEKVILVENNSTGQLSENLKLAGIEVNKAVLKYDGRPFFRDELIKKLGA